MVSQALAPLLIGPGHGVMAGTRDVTKTLARTAPDMTDNPYSVLLHV